MRSETWAIYERELWLTGTVRIGSGEHGWDPSNLNPINITTGERPLMRITVTGSEAFTLQSNLDERASAATMADAVEELGRSFGGNVQTRARNDAATLRARRASAEEGAQVLIYLVAALFGEVDAPPVINVDLADAPAAVN